MDQDDLIALVKDSGLRGRGGAGFPTGMKWGFIPQGDGKPHYLVVNADESEPGTCKDVPLMMATPHTLVEGVILTCYAIRANHAFIYVRGEVLHVVRRLQRAVQEAYLAGHLGKDIHGSGFDLDVIVHAGAGAYICGEETALLDSLEGRRGQPRLRPPFPAVAGLYAAPTVINNVESIASVPSIVRKGAEWFSSMGTEKSKGMTLYSLSGQCDLFHAKDEAYFKDVYLWNTPSSRMPRRSRPDLQGLLRVDGRLDRDQGLTPRRPRSLGPRFPEGSRGRRHMDTSA